MSQARIFRGSKMSEPILSPFGFSDSELQGYERIGDALVVRVLSWNKRTLTVRFRDVIGVRDSLAWEFSAAVEGAAASDHVLKEALRRSFAEVPLDHTYRVYSFLSRDDEPSLEVVAAGYEVAVGEPRPSGDGSAGSAVG